MFQLRCLCRLSKSIPVRSISVVIICHIWTCWRSLLQLWKYWIALNPGCGVYNIMHFHYCSYTNRACNILIFSRSVVLMFLFSSIINIINPLRFYQLVFIESSLNFMFCNDVVVSCRCNFNVYTYNNDPYLQK